MAVSRLESAYLRVERGRQHLGRLRRLCDDVCDGYADRLLKVYPPIVVDGGQIQGFVDSKHPEPEIPPRVAILIGEALYNFRAALDYLVCALSQMDTPHLSGGRDRRNQFPIEHSQHGFRSRRRTFLGGVSDANVLEIERFQPFRGCSWTATLAALSNRDKHNDLVIVWQGLEFSFEERESPAPMKMVVTPQLTLGRDLPLPGVIENIAAEVLSALELFRPRVEIT